MTRKEEALQLRAFVYHIFSDGEVHTVDEVARRAKISYDKAAGMLYGFSLGSSKWGKVWREDNVLSYRRF